MVRTILSLALAALTLLPSATIAQSNVQDGPNVLDDCVACPYLYKPFYTCARKAVTEGFAPTRTNVGDCVCPPRASEGSDNGWYPYIEACSNCLPRSSESESGVFWNNMASVFWQAVNECRGSRNITTDTEGLLCVGMEKSEFCLALRDASEGPTKAGYRLYGYEENYKSLAINLAAFKPNSTTTSAAATATETTASGTATGLESVAVTTTAPPADTATGAGNQAATTTSAPSLAAARLSQGSLAGYALGGLLVAGIVGLL
jgi:hypothetical protein